MRNKLAVCSTCLKKGEAAPRGDALATELRAKIIGADILDFQVETVECMNVCDQPTTVSFRAEGKSAYLFADIDPETDQDDIVGFARLYAESSDGVITDARPAGRLRHLLVGRIPS